MKIPELRLGHGLSLPLSAVTQTFGVLAVRGAGKSNLGACMAEEMHAAGLPFVVIDPVGSWPGLRSSADGKKPGLDIPVFGGRRGDLPLERTAGVLVADLVVDKRMSCVLDVSDFSEGDKTRFLIDFAERLYRRNTEPLHLFLEEADDYIPQRPMHEQARLLHAWENIVRRGRARGLGITMITQRSAAINKNVLTQIETLFVLRTTSPQDIKAIEGWVRYHGQSAEVLASLSQLENGEAWVWSPSYLRRFDRVRVRRRWTYDTGATPKDVKGVSQPLKLAKVDLAAIEKQMAETIEHAKENDPKELHKRISVLTKKLADVQKMPLTAEEQVELKQLRDANRELHAINKTLIARIDTAINEFDRVFRDGGETLGTLSVLRNASTGNAFKAVLPAVYAKQTRAASPTVVQPAASATASPSNGAMGEGERKILIAAAQTTEGATREQLTLLAGYKRSTRDAYIQRLRAKGYVEERSGNIFATDIGVRELGDAYEPLPTGGDLLEHWLMQLPDGERKILAMVAKFFPSTVTRDAISDATQYKRSTRDAYLQRLSVRRLVTCQGSAVIASEELFDSTAKR